MGQGSCLHWSDRVDDNLYKKITNPKKRSAATRYIAVQDTARKVVGASVISGLPRGTLRSFSGISIPPLSGSAEGDILYPGIEGTQKPRWMGAEQ